MFGGSCTYRLANGNPCGQRQASGGQHRCDVHETVPCNACGALATHECPAEIVGVACKFPICSRKGCHESHRKAWHGPILNSHTPNLTSVSVLREAVRSDHR